MSSNLKAAARVAGFVLHLLIAIVPFAGTGLVAPPWALVVVYAWWAVLLFVAVRLARDERRRAFVLLVPAVGLAGWIAFVSFGGAVLGWTA